MNKLRLPKISPVIFLELMLLPVGLMAQYGSVNISGTVRDLGSGATLPFVNVQLKRQVDSSFVAGTITHDNGLFSISEVKPGDYVLELSSIGLKKRFLLCLLAPILSLSILA